MLENTSDDQPTAETPADASTAAEGAAVTGGREPRSAAKKSAAKRSAAKKSAAKKATAEQTTDPEPADTQPVEKKSATKKSAAKKSTAKKTAAKKTAAPELPDASDPLSGAAGEAEAEKKPAKKKGSKKKASSGGDEAGDDGPGTALLFRAPEPTAAPDDRGSVERAEAGDERADAGDESADIGDESADDAEGGAARRRRRRGGRRRRKSADSPDGESTDGESAETAVTESDDGPSERDEESSSDAPTRRRRRRRRAGESGGDVGDDPDKTVTRVRKSRSSEDQITAVSGSTRLEAKKQRRREGREAGRRRAPIVSEAEFLARRESVERVMVIRQSRDLTQIAVLEDKVLVEHYVARESQTSLIGNVYLGRVQNVLPSMEAAFVDVGKGRNAVLYAGEVNWSALGHPDGQPRKIESVLSSGQSIMVQVTKDPVGHKGARLTSQISLAGRFLVYVPDGTTSGISRKLPDTERNRLKTLLKEIVPDSAGVIVRTAAEGASEDELTRDVERLKARWEDIERKGKGGAPQLLYGEPDLTLKVVRDLFTEDFTKLVIEGDDAWETVRGYVTHVAPDLEERLERFPVPDSGSDAFAAYRIDEQIAKGLDRKVWLPSGGSLVIDRTEAMTVVDVNTGKFTGSGGNLEETVTKNNLEAAEEMVRQLRLRDIGGIIVIDFIDMVLESNRDLVMRRLVECLGRDRTRHQVAEVTSLGLVQMTRKRIGTGLLEAFSEPCDQCGGRGLRVLDAPVEPNRTEDEPRRGGRRSRGGRARTDAAPAKPAAPSPKDVAAVAKPEPAAAPVDEAAVDELPVDEAAVDEAAVDEAAVDEAAVDEAAVDEAAVDEALVDEAPVDGVEEPQAPADPVQTSEPDPAGAPEPVTVVTRTRRRSASRPAGPPPVAVGAPAGESMQGENPARQRAIGSPAEAGDVEPSGSAGTPVVTHVPVKKRGARRR